MDSGASHYVTDNPPNLTSATEFSGNEEIIIGNSNGIPISHIGHSTLHSNSTTHPFTPHQVLCSPKIKRNLISVAQFFRENLTSIEFFPYSYLIKDLSTRAILLQGRSKDDLYEWPAFKPSFIPQLQANFAAQSSPTLHLWHARFGHPQPRITKSYISAFSLQVSRLPFVIHVSVIKVIVYPLVKHPLLVVGHLKLSILIYGDQPLSHLLITFTFMLFLLITLQNIRGFIPSSINLMLFIYSPILKI